MGGDRNRDPILSVFNDIFFRKAAMCSNLQGAGNHINYFAPHFPNLSFQPSDYNVEVSDAIKRNAPKRAAGISSIPSRSI